MLTHKTSHPIPLLLVSGLVIFATLACNLTSRPAKTPQVPPPINTLPAQPAPVEAQTAQAQTQEDEIQQTQQVEYLDKCSPPPIQAQDGSTIFMWIVDLWPEFDRPSMLVINQITLSSALVLPAELTFRIPAGAGEPNAVAVQDSGGSLINVEYTRTVQGDWATIRLTAANPRIQIEYYDPRIEKNGSARHFKAQWISDYAVDDLLIRLQPPASAANIQISPQMSGPGLSPDGKAYYCQNLGALKSNDSFSIVIDYANP